MSLEGSVRMCERCGGEGQPPSRDAATQTAAIDCNELCSNSSCAAVQQRLEEVEQLLQQSQLHLQRVLAGDRDPGGNHSCPDCESREPDPDQVKPDPEAAPETRVQVPEPLVFVSVCGEPSCDAEMETAARPLLLPSTTPESVQEPHFKVEFDVEDWILPDSDARSASAEDANTPQPELPSLVACRFLDSAGSCTDAGQAHPNARSHPHCCQFCGRSYADKHMLQEHIHSHTEEQTYYCEQCGRCFSYPSELAEHCRMHSGERPFVCGQCGKSFIRKYHLKTHSRTHSGEQPYSCGQCGKSFSRKDHLMAHSYTHSGKLPFACGQCGKSFSRKDHLKTHSYTHSGEISFPCGECGKSFRQKGNLTKHSRIHTGERPFVCRECGVRFREQRHLKRHSSTHGK